MTLPEAVQYYEENDPRGEYVLILEGAPEGADALSEEERMQQALALVKEFQQGGMRLKDAVKQAAKQADVRKNALYQKALEKE